MIEDLQHLIPGLLLSLRLLAVSLAVGLPLGLGAGLALFEGGRLTRFVLRVLIEIGRGFPALVTLYVVYFGLPSVGVVLDAFPALVVAFGYTTAAYTADIFRSALDAVPPEQHEAAAALALSRTKAFVLVIGPQAVRIVIPPLIGFSIIVFQGTALAYSIGLRELVSRAFDQGSLHFDILHYMLLAASLYLAISITLSLATQGVHKRMTRTVKPRTPTRESLTEIS